MTKKKLAQVLLIVFLSPTYSILARERCECGEHATGITVYHVTGTDCCKDTPEEAGFYYTYQQQSNGVWTNVSQTQITGTAAQNTCCENTST
ncbi:MAG: hypothetical protein OHK0019_18380 [Saprospiraceae bacterium]